MEAWDELCATLTGHREIVERTEHELIVAIEGTRRRVQIARREAFDEEWIEISCFIGSAKRFDVTNVMREAAGLAFGALSLDGDRLSLRTALPLARYGTEELDTIVDLIGRSAAKLARRRSGGALTELFEQYA